MVQKADSVRLWKDDRARPHSRWVVTWRQGSRVIHFRRPTRREAREVMAALKSKR